MSESAQHHLLFVVLLLIVLELHRDHRRQQRQARERQRAAQPFARWQPQTDHERRVLAETETRLRQHGYSEITAAATAVYLCARARADDPDEALFWELAVQSGTRRFLRLDGDGDGR